jgi:acyl-CoA synthetase (AMP-forming)/AMP-acid ligase II
VTVAMEYGDSGVADQMWEGVQPEAARRLHVAGLRLFAAQELHDTTTRALAACAGISPAAIDLARWHQPGSRHTREELGELSVLLKVAWRDVLSNALRAANGLLELGVRPGERVAILMGNRPEFLWAHLGIVFIGAASVPVNISRRGPALQHILMESSAAAVIFTDDLRDVLAAVADDLPGLRHTVVCGGPAGRGADWDFDRHRCPFTTGTRCSCRPSGR